MSDSARHIVVEKNQKYKMERKLREGYSGGEELRRAMAALAGPRQHDDQKEVRGASACFAATVELACAIRVICHSKGARDCYQLAALHLNGKHQIARKVSFLQKGVAIPAG